MNPISFTGVMARRLLVNWRVPAELAAQMLPPGVEPKTVGGSAIVGLCLVRLKQLRPSGLPAWVGLSSENLAIRMGVTGARGPAKQGAVLILDRWTGSRANALFCRHIGYGVHRPGRFAVREGSGRAEITVSSDRGATIAQVFLETGGPLTDSAFGSMADAESFFRGGERGFSPSAKPGEWDCLRLELGAWRLEPMRVRHAYSWHIQRLFGDAAEFDSAVVMRDIEHTWVPCGRETLGLSPAVKICLEERPRSERGEGAAIGQPWPAYRRDPDLPAIASSRIRGRSRGDRRVAGVRGVARNRFEGSWP